MSRIEYWELSNVTANIAVSILKVNVCIGWRTNQKLTKDGIVRMRTTSFLAKLTL
jgi:hypothetical protein